MKNRPSLLGAALITLVFLQGCATTGHPVTASTLGKPVTAAEMERVIDQPGPAELQTINSADWAVAMSGLLNLDHPTAKAAGIQDHEEPIHVYAHVLKHPTQGVFLIDTGTPQRIADDPAGLGVAWHIRAFMKTDKLQIHQSTADIVAAQKAPLAGVFLTHAHLDHSFGLPEIPNDVPVYVGKTETTAKQFLNAFVHGTSNRFFAGKGALREWPFQATNGDIFESVVDVFGDASVFAIWVPGHTAGSTAFVVRTTSGPVLLTGDTSHTRWGWDHGVEPGSYTSDHQRNAESLMKLKALAQRHPVMRVRLGHQE